MRLFDNFLMKDGLRGLMFFYQEGDPPTLDGTLSSAAVINSISLELSVLSVPPQVLYCTVYYMQLGF